MGSSSPLTSAASRRDAEMARVTAAITGQEASLEEAAVSVARGRPAWDFSCEGK